MAWERLADRLNKLPRLLAGPVLRRVTADAPGVLGTVTVWVALKTRAKVTLNVFDGKDKTMTGSRQTVAIGKNLHIVAVTAITQPPFSGPSEGKIYQYDLIFDFDGGPTGQSLAQASNNGLFSYGSFKLPTFAFPPKDLNSVRIIQGSCRMPHASGLDNLAILDELIAQAAENPIARPHHLLLTGDQIYADDVASVVLIMLSEAANTLLGWQEILPVRKENGGPRAAHEFSPYLRNTMLKGAGFTSDDLITHLMSLGEYLSMYLFVWSDVLWPSPIASFDDVVENVKGNVDPRVFKHWTKFLNKKEDGINGDIKDVHKFLRVLPKVRRALANIPSSMIFDDHEVTDDWNMTTGFCFGVYRKPPLGKRIIQNGLVAYALCQHWGNVPEEFDDSGQAPAGLTLLRLLEQGDATTYEQNSPRLQQICSVHEWDVQKGKPDFGLFHDQDKPLTIRGKKLFADSLTYNYTVEMPAYQVIMTDTRSWRSFPRGNAATGDLIPKTQFKPQILDTPPLNDRALLVVLSTNMPPVQSIRSATRHSTISTKLGSSDHPDLFEAWEIPSEPFDRLVVNLSDKLAQPGSSTISGYVILLSGDVHHSFASRMLYRATKRFEDTQNKSAAVVFAQLVCSSLKKQTGQTLGMDRDGYAYGPTGAAWLVPKHAPEGYAGFLLPMNTVVGERQIGVKSLSGQELWSPLRLEEATVQFRGAIFDPDETQVRLTVKPDYRYRLDYLNATAEALPPQNLPRIAPVPSGQSEADRKKAADAFNKATGNYRVYNKGTKLKREINGLNNIGEITFSGTGKDKLVNHTLRWIFKFPNFIFTTTTVTLNPDDPDFRDIKAAKEP
jgi:hypothetical protein